MTKKITPIRCHASLCICGHAIRTYPSRATFTFDDATWQRIQSLQSILQRMRSGHRYYPWLYLTRDRLDLDLKPRSCLVGANELRIVFNDSDLEFLRGLQKRIPKYLTPAGKSVESYRADVEIVSATNLRLRCKECACVWTPNILPGGKLPHGYWKCPDGCNH